MTITAFTFGLLFMVAVVGLLFLPTIIAVNRDHKHVLPIFLANLFLGWSGIVWFLLILWAFIDNIKK